MKTPTPHYRILVIDDNPAIHDDIRKILCPQGNSSSVLQDTKSLLFGDQPTAPAQDSFEIDSAFQGEEGLHKVEAASAEGRPYALAFVDVRMPPGWDGVETITRIWRHHPALQVVICTAYSDYSWEDMVRQIGRSSSMVVLKKPFDNIEVLQLAHALTEKWKLSRQLHDQLHNLDRLVDQRTAELRDANTQLTREINERLLVEKALVLSEERFSKAFQANPIPLAIQSLERETFGDANAGFQQLTGYDRDELRGRTAAQLNLWVDPAQGRQIMEKLRGHRAVRHLPCRLRTRQGVEREILLSLEVIELAGETSLLTIAQDITEQLLLERQLRHSQKMEAVGQLAAGIAHDFNNMLTVIQGNASLIISDQPPTSPDLPMLEGILAAAKRSAKLVRQLLTFSHKQMMETRLLNLTEVNSLLTEMLPPLLGEQIAISVDFPPDLPPITADAGMIEQMLMNLAVNARDAMPRGGQLQISGEAITLTPELARQNSDARPGTFLRLNIRDTGSGIPPDVLPRIFEPFYTTKPVGQGTGLGLATVYGIVKQHEGWIEVESAPGHGTLFRAYFPLAKQQTLPPFVPPPPELTNTRGVEKILVVEDEETVRCCVTHILRSQGYQVVTASSGVEALRVWAERTGDFDLLLTDLVMPDGLTGLELARRLVAERPALKVIYTSGYSRDIAKTQSPFPQGHQFLGKPYQSSVLLQSIRQSFDSTPALTANA